MTIRGVNNATCDNCDHILCKGCAKLRHWHYSPAALNEECDRLANQMFYRFFGDLDKPIQNAITDVAWNNVFVKKVPK
jgi:hypothetical protein